MEMNQPARSTNGEIIRPSSAIPNHGRSRRSVEPVAPTEGMDMPPQQQF
jgi:hypothetical protein